MVLVCIWRKSFTVYLADDIVNFFIVDVVEHLRQIDIVAIDSVSHHWSGCVDGDVISHDFT